MVRERNLDKLLAMFYSRYFFPVFNFSIFSGLLVCQLIIESLTNLWMLAFCSLGAVGNLYRLFRVSNAADSEVPPHESPRSDEQSAIMSDLEKEIVRRREIKKVEKN